MSEREKIEARIAELEADNAAAPGWGAAVGARAGEIKHLKRSLAAMENQDRAAYQDWCVQMADGELPPMSFGDWLRERARIRAEREG